MESHVPSANAASCRGGTTMNVSTATRTSSQSNLALLELDHLDRFGTYTRLHFEERSYTNLEELRFAGALAGLLRNFGVEQGDRVLVMMPNSPELMAAFG